MPFGKFCHAAAHLYCCLIFYSIKKNKTTKNDPFMSDEITKIIIKPNKNVPFICKQCRPRSLIGFKLFAYRNFFLNIRNE